MAKKPQRIESIIGELMAAVESYSNGPREKDVETFLDKHYPKFNVKASGLPYGAKYEITYGHDLPDSLWDEYGDGPNDEDHVEVRIPLTVTFRYKVSTSKKPKKTK